MSSCSDEKTSTEPKIAASKHSEAFNQSIDTAMNSYYALSEALVRWDSVDVISKTEHLHASLQKIKVEELKLDTTVSTKLKDKLFDISYAVGDIDAKSDLTTKRHAFHFISEHLHDFLKTVQYDRKKLYVHECEMPFDDAGRAIWLSKTDTLRNPYLGLHHPHYGSGMLHCGKHISTIDFTAKEK